MKQTCKFLSAGDLAERWGVHRSTATRVMNRFGVAGMKFGRGKTAARRFSEEDAVRVESAAIRLG